MNESKNKKTIAAKFPVVGIGASAGGLDALKKIIAAIPGDSGMAYMILQHLSPDYTSNLSEILSKHSSIPVSDIIHDINLVPNHIYIIPENNNVIAINGVLKLKFRTRNEKRNNIIDIFFESLAQSQKTFAIGVILSGNALDGTTGLKKIKECGGVTIAQDPRTAKYKGMLQTAINADAVDYVAFPENIPSQLLDIQRSYHHNQAHSEEERIAQKEDEIFLKIINIIYLRTGNDFRHYKHSTLRRRIARRMVITQKDSALDYFNFLRNNKEEQDSLFNDLLISVTYFFRDQDFFDNLAHTAFPLLLKNHTGNSLRIWVAGCSTGEEAYSLAICLHEYLLQNNQNIKVQIFASDISEACIMKARAGIYTYQDIQMVSDLRIRNYFTKIDSNYHIGKIPREMCVFATHNMITDTPFAKIDLISCRNVLIYFNPALQNKVLKSFHFSLKEKGLLFLGKSETTNNAKSLFEAIKKNEKIYIRRASSSRSSKENSTALPISVAAESDMPLLKFDTQYDFRKNAFEILSSQFAPAGVEINKSLDILHFHGDNSPYLNFSPGKADLNILKLVHQEISYELQNAIIKAKKEKIAVHKNDLWVKQLPYLISFHVSMIDKQTENLMVLFYKKTFSEINSHIKDQKTDFQCQQVENLEKELLRMREDDQRKSTEIQSAFEALQKKNEELFNSSEELQLLNEELESSAEELQCNIEELMCVNDELLDRQQQLISMRNYSESIIKTIREPLIVVDEHFNVKSANASFYNYFHCSREEIEGHSFFEIGNGQWNITELKDTLSKVIDEKRVIENFRVDILTEDMGKKSVLLNARSILNAKPQMILIVLEDITHVLKTNAILSSKNAELQSHNRQLEVFSSTASHNMQEPLRKIQMFCRKFLEDEKNLSQEGERTLQRVLSLTSHMSELVNSLINYYSINFMPREFKKTDLNLILKKILNEFKDEINKKNIKVEASKLPHLSVIPEQIRQLLKNLLSNSINYAKDDANTEIRIDNVQPSEDELNQIGLDHGKKYVKIVFIDNGSGFDQNYKDRVFDPFYRLHNSDKYRGSGLGLTSVKKIVENHSGVIKISSQSNVGTQIFLYLPI